MFSTIFGGLFSFGGQTTPAYATTGKTNLEAMAEAMGLTGGEAPTAEELAREEADRKARQDRLNYLVGLACR